MTNRWGESGNGDRFYFFLNGFPGSSDGKVFTYNAGDPGSIPGSERSPGEAVQRKEPSYTFVGM